MNANRNEGQSNAGVRGLFGCLFQRRGICRYRPSPILELASGVSSPRGPGRKRNGEAHGHRSRDTGIRQRRKAHHVIKRCPSTGYEEGNNREKTGRTLDVPPVVVVCGKKHFGVAQSAPRLVDDDVAQWRIFPPPVVRVSS